MRFVLEVDGTPFDVAWNGKEWLVDGEPTPLVGRPAELTMPGTARVGTTTHRFRVHGLHTSESNAGGASNAVLRLKPPMTGKLESLRVQAGQRVHKGDVLFVLEAMKMLNDVRAPRDGVVTAVHAAPGATVETQTVILELGPAERAT